MPFGPFHGVAVRAGIEYLGSCTQFYVAQLDAGGIPLGLWSPTVRNRGCLIRVRRLTAGHEDVA
jgi:hypothetical protein